MKMLQTNSPDLQAETGRIYYSNMISKATPGVEGKNIYLYEQVQEKNRFYLVANSAENEKGRVVIFDEAGELLISQVIEVYKGKQRAEKHLGIYSLYVMFYPQLVAGPIERPQNLLHLSGAARAAPGSQSLHG